MSKATEDAETAKSRAEMWESAAVKMEEAAARLKASEDAEASG